MLSVASLQTKLTKRPQSQDEEIEYYRDLFRAAIRATLGAANVTYTHVARELDIPPQDFKNFLNGKRYFAYPRLEKIARFLDLDDFLISIKDVKGATESTDEV